MGVFVFVYEVKYPHAAGLNEGLGFRRYGFKSLHPIFYADVNDAGVMSPFVSHCPKI